MNLLTCENLQFGYKNALCAPFDFKLYAGDLIALVGPNGSGKSTFLKTLAGYFLPFAGKIKMGDSEKITTQMTPLERAKKIDFVQMRGLNSGILTTREFVSLGRSPYTNFFDGKSLNDERIVDEALELFSLTPFKNRLLMELSDGERSRVFLAKAIAQQVDILLLDEPHAFLDIPHTKMLFKILQDLAFSKNKAIILSTHSLEMAEKYCEKMIVINSGKITVSRVEDAKQKGLLKWAED